MTELGVQIGHCPTCFIAVGEQELGVQCSKCGQLLFKENLLTEVDIEVAKQTHWQSVQTSPYPSGWDQYHKQGGNKY